MTLVQLKQMSAVRTEYILISLLVVQEKKMLLLPGRNDVRLSRECVKCFTQHNENKAIERKPRVMPADTCPHCDTDNRMQQII